MFKYAMKIKESNTLLDPFDLLKFIIDKYFKMRNFIFENSESIYSSYAVDI